MFSHEDFLKWLDEERIKAVQEDGPVPPKSRTYYDGRLSAFDIVKEKFLTLTPPPTTLN